MQEPGKKIHSAHKSAGFGLVFLLATAACQQPLDATDAPQPLADSGCGQHGRLQASLVGGIATELDWFADDFKCESMQRPDADGIRLRFSGAVAGEQLAIIIAIPGLRSDQDDVELPSNVTVSVEGSGRFFSTPDLNSCWTDIQSQRRLPGNSDAQGSEIPGKKIPYTLTGTLNCVAPLGELNGDSAISIPELSFTGTVNWSAT